MSYKCLLRNANGNAVVYLIFLILLFFFGGWIFTIASGVIGVTFDTIGNNWLTILIGLVGISVGGYILSNTKYHRQEELDEQKKLLKDEARLLQDEISRLRSEIDNIRCNIKNCQNIVESEFRYSANPKSKKKLLHFVSCDYYSSLNNTEKFKFEKDAIEQGFLAHDCCENADNFLKETYIQIDEHKSQIDKCLQLIYAHEKRIKLIDNMDDMEASDVHKLFSTSSKIISK